VSHKPRASSNPELGKCRFLSSGSSYFLAVSPEFSLVLDPGGGLGCKIGSACEEFKDNEGGILG